MGLFVPLVLFPRLSPQGTLEGYIPLWRQAVHSRNIVGQRRTVLKLCVACLSPKRNANGIAIGGSVHGKVGLDSGGQRKS
jgi:hypothetical protein